MFSTCKPSLSQNSHSKKASSNKQQQRQQQPRQRQEPLKVNARTKKKKTGEEAAKGKATGVAEQNVSKTKDTQLHEVLTPLTTITGPSLQNIHIGHIATNHDTENTTPIWAPKVSDYRYSRTPPGQDLDALQELVDKLLLTNSTTAKRALLKEYPGPAPLLAWIYDPSRQFNVSSARLVKYAKTRTKEVREQHNEAKALTPPSTQGFSSSSNSSSNGRASTESLRRGSGVYDTLPELLNALSTRAVSGHAALDTILLFMRRFCTTDKDQNGSTTEIQRNDDINGTLALFNTSRSKLLFRILDKNLKAGCNVNLIRDAYPNLIPGFHVALGHSLSGGLEQARLLFKVVNSDTVSTPSLGSNEKGKREKKKTKAKKKQEAVSFTDKAEVGMDGWYASRKLDGVRCLIRIDRLTGEIETLSRTGKAFESLGPLREELRRLLSSSTSSSFSSSIIKDSKSEHHASNGDEIRRRERFFERALGWNKSLMNIDRGGHPIRRREPLPETLILDGELCVFSTDPALIPDTEINSNLMSSAQGNEDSDDNSNYTSGSIDLANIGSPDDELGQERFLKAVSVAKRGWDGQKSLLLDGNDEGKDKNDDNKEDGKEQNKQVDKEKERVHESLELERTMEEGSSSKWLLPRSDVVVYCLFDCLTGEEFQERIGTRPFSERIRGITEALEMEKAHPHQRNTDEGPQAMNNASLPPSSPLIRVLQQTRIKDFEQLEAMVVKGMKRGWEGVILRKDVGYEGKRSRNLLKIKQFQDAEFIVQDAMLGSMRLAVNGQFEELDNVLTNVVILHRGNRVRVGSGFSAEERIRYGKDPSLIVGKTITVKYFEESKTQATATPLPSTSSPTSLRLSSDSHTVTEAGAETENGVGVSDKVNRVPQEENENRRESHGENMSNGQVVKGEDSFVWSLRFPTVKMIYEDGPRQM
ncbi:hypothetical protein BCR41DRAFT_346205 [Lobosporangium transversale]|uniref:ATP-dependent DNA ligase family profile domain-containing protein n=1 Tax=Lobosporangium transversale TaxID=64571 RepID=A0A1Y2H014_9FUNG|nr:hypothetical protein BCR41DRAFT_346205 [Lobosporangium transversale]ORZ27899.1 hypothetical protein BCR41DRAFT_346205 [Lobosporangium transversale]|eukprot:XP_021885602.1 hypothetical protein BCR41DRAFT_346205 [Lobosporangium transversale]